MNNVTTFDNFPPFAINGRRNMNTESAKYAVGFLEGETFPAEWANYLFHGATKGISDLNMAVQSIWKENINVIQGSGQTPSSSDNTQLKTAIELMIQNAVLTANAQILAQAKLDAHPVGSLYWSADPTDPSILFGGVWSQIKNRFIWAKGDSDALNATGGSKTVQLTESNLPAHNHGGATGYTNTDHWHATFDMDRNGYGYVDNVAGLPGGSGGNLKRVNGGRIATLGNSGADYHFKIECNISHTHNTKTVTETYSNNNQNHIHTIPSCGGNVPHENMPPYITKYCWERID